LSNNNCVQHISGCTQPSPSTTSLAISIEYATDSQNSETRCTSKQLRNVQYSVGSDQIEQNQAQNRRGAEEQGPVKTTMQIVLLGVKVTVCGSGTRIERKTLARATALATLRQAVPWVSRMFGG
jgi:hypothetical protein